MPRPSCLPYSSRPLPCDFRRDTLEAIYHHDRSLSSYNTAISSSLKTSLAGIHNTTASFSLETSLAGSHSTPTSFLIEKAFIDIQSQYKYIMENITPLQYAKGPRGGEGKYIKIHDFRYMHPSSYPVPPTRYRPINVWWPGVLEMLHLEDNVVKSNLYEQTDDKQSVQRISLFPNLGNGQIEVSLPARRQSNGPINLSYRRLG